MNLQNFYAGGFTALNTGLITDSYSKNTVAQKSAGTFGGFCAENKGEIIRCAAQGAVRGSGRKNGFCARQNGSLQDCFWLRHAKDAEKQWVDWDISFEMSGLEETQLNGWDFHHVWKITGEAGKKHLALFDIPETKAGEVQEIRSRADLKKFAEEVNSGKAEPGKIYRLMADINMGGASWNPAGLDENTPFCSFFDGNGHSIRNFTVHAGKHPYAGLFGYVDRRGTVANLHVDCTLTGHGSSAGPVCGANSGTIINCTAASVSDLSRYTGGLAGQNHGSIMRCAAFGKIRKSFPIPWPLFAAMLVMLSIPAPAYFYMTAQQDAQEIFAPVILDPNAEPIAPEAEITPDPEDTSDNNATFIMNAEMYVSTENYTGAIGLKCPTWSSRGFVATVYLTQADQAKIGYSGGSDIVLYQSGLLAPGYGIDNITLGNLPDGSKLPAGEYEFSVLLEFYNVETNEKAATNTVIPLEVTIE